MFDSHNSTSVDRMLAAPEKKSHVLDDDQFLDRIEAEDKQETFRDYEFLSLIRSEITDRSESKKEGDEIVRQLPYTPTRYKIFNKALRLLGWRYFRQVDLPAHLEDIELERRGEREEEAYKPEEDERRQERVTDDEIVDNLLEMREKEGGGGQFRISRRNLWQMIKLRIKRAFLKSDLVIGFDLGGNAVKYAQIRITERGSVLDRYHLYAVEDEKSETPAEKRSHVMQALQRIVPHDLLPVSDVAVTVSLINVIVKIDTLPRIDRKELDEAVRFKSTKDLPSSIKDPLVLSEIVESVTIKGTPHYRMRIYIVDRQEIEAWTTLFQEAGIRPIRFNLPHDGIVRSAQAFHPAEIEKGTMLFDFGGRRSHLIFMDRGIVRLIRQIEFGLNDLIEPLKRDYEVGGRRISLNQKTAEKLLGEYGIPNPGSVGSTENGIPLARIATQLYPKVEQLATELKRNVGYYRSNNPESPLESIVISGGGADLLNLHEYIERETGLSVKRFDLPETFSIGRDIADLDKLRNESHLLAGCIGTALKSDEELNILPGRLKDRKKKRLTVIAAAMLALITATILSVESYSLRMKLGRVNGELTEVKNELNRVRPELKGYQEMLREFEALKGFNTFVSQSAVSSAQYDRTVSIMKAVSKIRYPGVVINRIAIREREYENRYTAESIDRVLQERVIELYGGIESDDPETTKLRFVMFLEELPYFSNIEYFNERDAQGINRKKFRIEMQIRPFESN